MAAGDILKEENLIVEVLTIATHTEIEKGEICTNTGSGMVPAQATTAGGPYYMALADRHHHEDHDAGFVKVGFVEVQAALGGTAVFAGEYVQISSTPGEVVKRTTGAIVGTVGEDSGTSDTTVKLLLGITP